MQSGVSLAAAAAINGPGHGNARPRKGRKTEPKGNETNGFFPLWEPLSSLRRARVASLAAIRSMALSPPTGSQRSCSRSAAHRKLMGMPERCSLARVRFAAPKTGAPLPAPRRSGGRQLRRAAPTGTRSSSRFSSKNLNSKTKERKSAATRPLHFPTDPSPRSEPISCSSFDWKMLAPPGPRRTPRPAFSYAAGSPTWGSGCGRGARPTSFGLH